MKRIKKKNAHKKQKPNQVRFLRVGQIPGHKRIRSQRIKVGLTTRSRCHKITCEKSDIFGTFVRGGRVAAINHRSFFTRLIFGKRWEMDQQAVVPFQETASLKAGVWDMKRSLRSL